MKKISKNDTENVSELYTLSKDEIISFIHGIVFGTNTTFIETDAINSFKFLVVSSMDAVSMSGFAESMYDYCGKKGISYIINFYDLFKQTPNNKGLADLLRVLLPMQTAIEEYHCAYEVEFDFVNETLRGVKYNRVLVQQPKPFVRVNWNQVMQVK